MRMLLPTGLALALLTGCSFSVGRSIQTSEVAGFGLGPTQAEAQRAAWDDAIARIREMGYTHFQVTQTGGSLSKGGPAWEAKVTLLVQREQPYAGS